MRQVDTSRQGQGQDQDHQLLGASLASQRSPRAIRRKIPFDGLPSHESDLSSDSFAANDWPIARDAADFLGVEIPDEEDDSDAVGDLDMLADLGLSEMELEAISNDLDSDAEDLLQQIAEKLAFGASYGKAVAQFDL